MGGAVLFCCALEAVRSRGRDMRNAVLCELSFVPAHRCGQGPCRVNRRGSQWTDLTGKQDKGGKTASNRRERASLDQGSYHRRGWGVRGIYVGKRRVSDLTKGTFRGELRILTQKFSSPTSLSQTLTLDAG